MHPTIHGLLTSAHLLGNHDGERSESGATDARNREQLDESGDIVGLLVDQGGFHSELGINVIQVSSCLQFGVAETLQGIEGISISALLDVPARGF